MEDEQGRYCPIQLIAAAVMLAAMLLAPSALCAQEVVDAAGKKLIAAQGMFARAQYKFACQEFEDFLAKYPQHAEAINARYMVAICQYRMDQHAKAAQMLEELLKDSKFAHRDEALAVLGHCRLTTKEYDKAMAAYDELLEKHPKSEHAQTAAASRCQLLYLLNKKQACIDACASFAKQYPLSPQEATILYFQGLALSDLGKWPEAADTLAGLLKKYPAGVNELDAMLVIGRCLEEQSKLDQAAAQYQEFLKKAPPPRQAEGKYCLGVVYHKGAKYAEAAKELSELLATSPGSQYAPAAKLQLAMAQFAAGKTADSRKLLAEIAKGDPARATAATYWLSQCDIAEGKFEQARATLDALAKLAPALSNIAAIQFDRAVCAMSLKQYDQAAGEFENFVKLYPSNAQAGEAMLKQAFCLHRLGKYAQSQSLLEKLPKDASPVAAASIADLSAENLFLLQKYDAAAEAYRKLLQEAKDDDRQLRLTMRLGQCACLAGKNDQAIALLKTVAENKKAASDANLREAILFLGEAQFQGGKFADAAKSLSSYVELSKTDKPEVKYKLAIAMLRSGQADAAERTLAEVAKAQADSPWAARGMLECAQGCYNNRQLDKAADLLGKSLAAKPPADVAAPALYLLGYVEMETGKHAQAAKRFTQLVEQYPGYELAPQASLQQAICLKQTGQAQEALVVLKGCLKGKSDAKFAAQVAYMTAQCQAALGKHAEAVKLLVELANDKTAVSEAVLYDLAWAQRETKNADSAAKTYQRLIDEFASGKMAGAARAELADLLYAGGKYPEAIALLEKAIAEKGLDGKARATAQFRLGWCYLKQDKHDKAVAAFEALAADAATPTELKPSAIFQAGTSYAALGKLSEAQAKFAEVASKYPRDDLAGAALLKLAEFQAQAQQFDKAAAAYDDFLKKYPKDKFAYLAQFGLGWSQENLKKYAEARAWYEKVIESHNGITAARAQFQIGETYFAQSKFEEAARELQKVDIVYDYPEWSAKALYEAGRAFEQLAQVEQAKAQYAACIKKYKDKDPNSAQLCEKRLAELNAARPK